MKFRGRIMELMAMKKFYNVLQSMSKLTKLCVLRLTSKNLYFIATEIIGHGGHLPTGGPVVWCELDQANFFNEYKLEGVTPEQPEIYLELEPDKILKALALIKSTRAVKIKLTKKHDQPCLSFDIDLTPSLASNNEISAERNITNAVQGRQCLHDVPVTVLPRRLWSDYAEPALQKPNLSIYLPDMKKLKHLTERYRNIGHEVVIEGQQTGKLVFKLETDEVTVSTHYQQLEVVQNDEFVDVDNTDKVSVRVDLRNLSLFLSADHIAPKRVLANIIRNKLLHLFLIHDAVLMQFYVTAFVE